MSYEIHRRARRRTDEDPQHEGETQHPRFSHATMVGWAAVGVGIAGIGTSLYGANKQRQAQEDANRENRAAIEGADRSAWNSYLMQRGIYGNNAATGTIPGMQPGGATNTRLPLWANLRMNTVPGAAAPGARPNVPFLVKRA